MSGSDERVRWTILFAGTVQGVGFRYTTERVARSFSVAGVVRNLPDGRVEVVAEGARGELKRFVEAVEEAMTGYVRERQQTESPGTGQYRGFSVGF